jgi:hypothetical protein
MICFYIFYCVDSAVYMTTEKKNYIYLLKACEIWLLINSSCKFILQLKFYVIFIHIYFKKKPEKGNRNQLTLSCDLNKSHYDQIIMIIILV